MAEIPFPTTWDVWNPTNNGINYLSLNWWVDPGFQGPINSSTKKEDNSALENGTDPQNNAGFLGHLIPQNYLTQHVASRIDPCKNAGGIWWPLIDLVAFFQLGVLGVLGVDFVALFFVLDRKFGNFNPFKATNWNELARVSLIVMTQICGDEFCPEDNKKNITKKNPRSSINRKPTATSPPSTSPSPSL